MDSFKVVSFDDSYQDQVIELILKIQVEEFGIKITIKDQPDLKQIPSFYQKDKGNFLVALDGEKVIGTIALVDIGNNQAALRKMFVDENYRGKEKGVAKALLDQLTLWSHEQGLSGIYLGTTSAYHAAHRFYEKNGFQKIQKSDLPETFSVMEVDSKFYKYSLN